MCCVYISFCLELFHNPLLYLRKLGSLTKHLFLTESAFILELNSTWGKRFLRSLIGFALLEKNLFF